MTNTNSEIKIDAEYIASNYDIKEKASLPGGHHFHFYPRNIEGNSDMRKKLSPDVVGNIAYETPTYGNCVNQYDCYTTQIVKSAEYSIFEIFYQYGGSYGHGENDTRYIKVIF